MLSFLRAAWLPVLFLALTALWVVLERSPEQRGDGVVLRWVVNSQERDQVFARAARDAFEAKHPGIRIQFIKQNEGRKVETMIAGGDAPDILEYGLDRSHYFVRAGVLRDLAPLMSDADRADLSSYFPVATGPFRQGERVYGLPWGYVPFVLFYNKNLFDKYGVPYPRDGWTWDDYRRAAKALTHDTDGDGVTDEFGASFAQWQEGYYSWIYQNGGRVLNEDGTQATFDDPKVVEAVAFLETLTRRDRVMPTETNKPKQVGMGLFEAGRMAMHGPTGSFYIPTYRTFEKVDWDLANVPAGPSGKGTMVAPLAFGVTTQSKHPREAWELVRFLGSEEGQQILAESGLFVPSRRSVALSDRFLNAPGLPENKYALVAMMDDRDGRRPWGVVPPWSGDRWKDVNDDALNAKLGSFLFGRPKAGETAESVCQEIDAKAETILAEDRATYQGVPMNWSLAIGSTAGVLGLLGAWWVVSVVRAARRSRLMRAEQVWGYLAISPWLIGFLLLGLGPILFSIFLSFTRWSSLAPPSTARWVGFDHYSTLLTGQDELFLKALQTTFYYTVLMVPSGLVAGLLLALLMNSKLRGINGFRTLYYLPAVMPAVASAVLFRWLLGQDGVLNYVAGGFGTVPMRQMPDWLGDPQWTIPAMVLMALWGVGGGMLIYLAGLQNVPVQLYEAARIDGAGPIAQFRAVTLPMLSPVLFFNLVMGIIGAFQVFTSAFVLFGGGSGPEDSALFYSFYLYRKAFEQFQVGYGSALAWVLFVIILAFTALVFRSSSFWVYYESQKETAR
ncbi:MAG: extracellular solute-binding protein [Armatimonadota bacterium]